MAGPGPRYEWVYEWPHDSLTVSYADEELGRLRVTYQRNRDHGLELGPDGVAHRLTGTQSVVLSWAGPVRLPPVVLQWLAGWSLTDIVQCHFPPYERREDRADRYEEWFVGGQQVLDWRTVDNRWLCVRSTTTWRAATNGQVARYRIYEVCQYDAQTGWLPLAFAHRWYMCIADGVFLPVSAHAVDWLDQHMFNVFVV